MTENIITEKTCSRCNISKELHHFYRVRTVVQRKRISDSCNDCSHLRQNAAPPEPIKDLPNEEWRVCVDNETYAVSNMGRVKRIKFNRYTKNGEYLLVPIINSNGYLNVSLNSAGKHFRVHRLVCRAFHGEPLPDQTDVNHIDNDRTNNRADNLHWCTRKENLHWGKQQGRDNTGERNGQAKLTEDIVKQIVHLLKTTDQPITHIARDFGIAQANVSFINLGKRWKYLTKDEILPLRK